MTDPLRIARQFFLFFAVLLACAPIVTVPCLAQEEKPDEPAIEIDEALLELKKQLKSPRQTVITFRDAVTQQDYEIARKCLDLSDLDPETEDAKYKTLAIKLHLVIEEFAPFFDLDFVSADPNVEPPYSIFETEDQHSIQLVPNKDGLWRFSKSTVELIDSDTFDYLISKKPADDSESAEAAESFPLWLQQQFDESWWKTSFLIQDYQWVCLLILLLAGLLIGQLCKWLLNFLTYLWFRYVQTNVDDDKRKYIGRPIAVLANIFVWFQGAKMIDLPASVMAVLLPVLKFLTIVAAVWTAIRIIDLISNYLLAKARTTASRYDDAIIPLVRTGLKLLAVAVGILLFVDVFNRDWTTVLGGFGVIGIAVAIAAKDMLGNFFGSITVVTDRPFEIGDWVVIDASVEGTVERVGIRSSRIRTFHNSQFVVPNSLLTTAIVDNMGRRNFRRFKTKLQVRYDTPVDLLDPFCEGIRELIRKNQYAKDDAHVFVNEFGQHSLDILLYMFFDCPDWAAELRERHFLITDILRLAEKLEIKFAFPTRTLEIESIEQGGGSPSQKLNSDDDPSSLMARAKTFADQIHQRRS